jgi:uncharacterized damage-inducible protein DinB
MMMSSTLLLAVALTAPAVQTPAGGPLVASIRGGYEMVKGNVLKAAEQVPEDLFAFQATPDVRTLGRLFAHIADANFGICATASGNKPPMSGIEKSKKTKAEITEALAASFKFCDAAFDGLTEASAAESVKFFGPGPHTRLSTLAFNAQHDWEHYGNIVTYMRLKGLVPPSSQR